MNKFRHLNKNFGVFWERRGSTIVIALCFTIIGVTAFLTRTAEPEEAPMPSMTVYTAPTPTPQPAMAQTITQLPAPTPPPIVSPVDEKQVGMGFNAASFVYSKTLGDWRLHPGTDYLGEEGSPVRALMGGRVISIYEDTYLGHCMRIDHQNGYESLYASLDEQVIANEGDYVSAGQVIALMGVSALSEREEGCHVHVELYKDGKAVNPESP